VIYVIEYVSKESKEKSLESEEFFLFETDVSFRLPKLYLPRGSRCAVINGFIYVLIEDVLNFCNGDITTLDGGMVRYDPISNQWKKCKRLDKRLNLTIMVSLGNELYVSEGGIKGENRLFKYDPIADEWIQRASLNGYRLGFGCTVFNRMLYVVGGCDDFFHPEVSSSSFDRYD